MSMIKEIFTSIQGEGPYVGYKQVFVRFCGCNLSCKYCDTEFDSNGAVDYTPQKLLDAVEKYTHCHSISLTGGEPLLQTDFLTEFLPECKLPVYLETNATLPNELRKVIDYITYISADIKLESATGVETPWEVHDEFFDIASKKELFAKVVFDKRVTHDEIIKTAELCSKYGIELVLQPMMKGDKLAVDSNNINSIFEEFLIYYPRVRVIPQTHKFMNVM